MKGKVLLKGISRPIQPGVPVLVVTCKVRVVTRDNLEKIKALETGECLVTDEIKPSDAPTGSDEEKCLHRAAGFIQNVGGRGCHLNSVAFGLKIPAISDTCSQSGGKCGTDVLKDGQMIVLEGFTETEEKTYPDGRTRRIDLGTVYEYIPDKLGKPSLQDIINKFKVVPK